MIFKQTMNTAKINAPDNEFFVDYYLVKRMYNHRRQKICYGVGVEKYFMRDRNRETVESEEVENISYDPGIAIEIVRKLYESTVTPMTVLDVLDDME